MKYVLLGDVRYILSKQKRYLIMYFVIMFGFFAIQEILGNDLNYETLIKCLGLDSRNRPYLNIIMFGFHLFFFIYLTISLFTKEVGTSQCNLLLRISIQRWFLYKLISIIVIVVLIELLNYLFILCFMLIKLKTSLYTCRLVIVNFLFLISCILFIINAYINKYCYIVGFLYVYFIYQAEFKIIDINIIFLILTILINFIVGIFIIKKYKHHVFEKI